MKTAVILAAGEGTKIVPYQETRQKAALPVGNEPAIRRMAQALIEMGVHKLIVVVGHRKEQVASALGDIAGVVFVEQQQRTGTNDAVLLAEPRVEDETFLVLHGDVVTAPENLKKLVREFESTGAEAAALVQPLGRERSLDWICASVRGEKLAEVSGHPRGSQFRLCGIYAFRRTAVPRLKRNPGIFRHVNVGGMPPVESELAASLQQMIEDGREVLAVQTADFHVDIDKPWHILEANHALLDYMSRHIERSEIHPTAKISDNAEIGGKIVVGGNSVIGDGVHIEGNLWLGADSTITRGAIVGANTMVGDRSRLRDYCWVFANAVIGDRCVVQHGAEFGGVTFDRVYLYHYCEIEAVLGSAVDIGAATVCGTLRFDDEAGEIPVKGRREQPSFGAGACFVGDYCRTGVNAILMPGCRVGPYSAVGPGVVVYDEVPPRTMVLLKQDLVQKPWGPEKYGW
jgi:bifunctional UDP-N-acetylglucosamine pyrophosphorylase/glucosamine-1-phosphate N-acetyltransferase